MCSCLEIQMFLWSTNLLDFWQVGDLEGSDGKWRPCHLGRSPQQFHWRTHHSWVQGPPDSHTTCPSCDPSPKGPRDPPQALWLEDSACVHEKPLGRILTHTLDSPLSFPCGTESQQAEICCGSVISSKMVSVVCLAFICWFIPFKSSSREAAERDLAWPMLLTSWDNIFIPGWSGSAPLDLDHSASEQGRPWLAPMSWRGEELP